MSPKILSWSIKGEELVVIVIIGENLLDLKFDLIGLLLAFGRVV